MIFKLLMLFVLVSHVTSDSCVRYTFGEDFHEVFVNEWGGACAVLPPWVLGKYSDLDLAGHNERSTSFISPRPGLSCASSFMFPMNSGGTIEVNIYMEVMDPTDQIIVLAYMLDAFGGRVTGQAFNTPFDPSFVSGWHTLKMTVVGPATYDGYISVMGMGSSNSIVLIDSFRYIPPGMDESECQLYEDLPKANHPRFKHFRA